MPETSPWQWEIRIPKGPGEATGMYDVCGTKRKPHLQRLRRDSAAPAIPEGRDDWTWNPDESADPAAMEGP